MPAKKAAADRRLAAALAQERARFLSFLASRVGSREEAEEVLQAAYLKGLKAGAGPRETEKVTAWFYALLRNALTDHWRRKDAERRALDQWGEETKRRAKLDEAKLEKRVCACVGKLVDTIKPEYAEAIREVDLEDSSVAGFAKRAGVTENSASVRLHRARKSLKTRLVQTCGACAEHGCRDCDCAH